MEGPRWLRFLLTLVTITSSLTQPIFGQDFPPAGCSPETETLDEGCRKSVQAAIDIATCCAMQTLDQELMECIDVIQSNLQADKIRTVDSGDPNAPFGWTEADYDCTSGPPFPPPLCLIWSADSACNCIVIDTQFTNTDCQHFSQNDQVAAGIMAAILVHEICHAKTGSFMRGPQGFTPVCDYLQNELECACKELDTLDCILQNCFSGGMSAGALEAWLDNRERVQKFKITIEQSLLAEGC